jgi:hypothetical protein
VVASDLLPAFGLSKPNKKALYPPIRDVGRPRPGQLRAGAAIRGTRSFTASPGHHSRVAFRTEGEAVKIFLRGFLDFLFAANVDHPEQRDSLRRNL